MNLHAAQRFLPDAKGVPRLVSVLMPVMPYRVFPMTIGSEKA